MGGLPEWSEGSGSRLMRRNDREIRDFNEILEITNLWFSKETDYFDSHFERF